MVETPTCANIHRPREEGISKAPLLIFGQRRIKNAVEIDHILADSQCANRRAIFTVRSWRTKVRFISLSRETRDGAF